jgi:hypothetical protein
VAPWAALWGYGHIQARLLKKPLPCLKAGLSNGQTLAAVIFAGGHDIVPSAICKRIAKNI